MLTSKKYIIHTNHQEKISRFLVDLKQKLAQEKKEKAGNKIKMPALLKKYFYKGQKEFFITKNKIAGIVEYLFQKNIKSPNKTISGRLKRLNKYNYYFSRLAFYPLIKFLFFLFVKVIKLILSLSYWIGYLTVFLIRFFILLFLSASRVLGKSGRNIGLEIKNRIQTGVKNIKLKFAYYQEKIKRERHSSSPSALVKGVKTASALWQTEKKNKRYIFNFSNFQFHRPRVKFHWPQQVLKHSFGFIFILIILIIPFKAFTYYNSLLNLRGRVLGVSEKGVNNLKQAADSAANLNFSAAEKDFSTASGNFLKAQTEINEVSGLLSILSKVIPNKDLKLAAGAGDFLSAGRLSSDLAAQLSASVDAILKNKDKSLPKIFFAFSGHLKIARADAVSLQKSISSIDPDNLPKNYQKIFFDLKNKVNFVSSALDELSDILDKAKTFLGFKMDKRYLLVFQNNAEMRASGGFVGSYALIDFSNGKIKNIEVPAGGSYDTEGGLKKLITAPQPLWLVNPLWHFWDANWWPDWPASARKLGWFLDKSGGPTVDGVISFTPTVMERILKIIGPIDMQAEYGKVISADNFWQTVQTIVEKKPAPALDEGVRSMPNFAAASPAIRPKPKKIIGDLLEKIKIILPARLNRNIFLNLFAAAGNSLNEKQIMFYFNDKAMEKDAIDLNWGGRIKNTSRDYLMVVNSNIAGGKSDKKIKEDINHSAKITANGDIIVSLKIVRKHTGKRGEPFSGVRNVDWMRIYVPLGSELLDARGFNAPDEKYFSFPDTGWKTDPDVAASEGRAKTNAVSGTKIYNEFNKTVFANWSMIDPGDTAVIYLRYRLPFKIYLPRADKTNSAKIGIENFFAPEQKPLLPYSLLAQKQPGSLGSRIESRLILPTGYKIIWRYPAGNDSIKESGWQIQSDLKTDKFWAVLITDR